jgi:hypothetical protein
MRGGGASAWLAGAGGWMGARKTVTRSQESYDAWDSNESGSERDARKKKGEWGQPRPGSPYL